MPFLIDGHNLIPKIPSLSLQEMDDEQQLISLLQEFCRLQRKNVEVFFDQAASTEGRARSYGSVLARFVRQGTSADMAIHMRLERLGRAARNWTVVSSDLAVQADARASRAHVMSSEEFSSLLTATLSEDRPAKEISKGETISQDELNEWLRIFGER
jgi:uncharacterized protein